MIVRWILSATLLILLVDPLATHAQNYACVGDCNLDGVVTVDELVLIAEIELGNASIDLCPAASANGDPLLTVDDFLQAVVNALARDATCRHSGQLLPQ
jgi:hypothetical protein